MEWYRLKIILGGLGKMHDKLNCAAVIFDLFETLITEWGHKKYTIGLIIFRKKNEVGKRLRSMYDTK